MSLSWARVSAFHSATPIASGRSPPPGSGSPTPVAPARLLRPVTDWGPAGRRAALRLGHHVALFLAVTCLHDEPCHWKCTLDSGASRPSDRVSKPTPPQVRGHWPPWGPAHTEPEPLTEGEGAPRPRWRLAPGCPRHGAGGAAPPCLGGALPYPRVRVLKASDRLRRAPDQRSAQAALSGVCRPTCPRSPPLSLDSGSHPAPPQGAESAPGDSSALGATGGLGSPGGCIQRREVTKHRPERKNNPSIQGSRQGPSGVETGLWRWGRGGATRAHSSVLRPGQELGSISVFLKPKSGFARVFEPTGKPESGCAQNMRTVQ